MMPKYEDLIQERTALYKSIKQSYCPVLKENVIFNSKGFYHFKYDGTGKARSRKERMYRVGLIPLIQPVIKNAKKVSSYTPRTYSKKLGKYVEFWVLREVVGRQKTTVTVILRRIGSGNITFYSVWKKRDKKPKKPSR